MTHLDLFSGIGGFALACRWAGIDTVQFCEIDPFCQAVLRKNFPGVPISDDIKTFHWTGDSPFILTGGVPCQPASRAGKQRGKDDDRWLWGEAIRILHEARPTWAVFENPPGIQDLYEYGISLDVDAEGNAIGEVGTVVDRVGRSVFRETMEAIEGEGYAIQVLEVPACAVNAPHLRNRLWIVGYSSENAGRILHEHGRPRESDIDIGGAAKGGMADTQECGRRQGSADGGRIREGEDEEREWLRSAAGIGTWDRYQWLPCADGKFRRAPDDSFGLADGLPRKLLAALGDSIVWPVAAEIIGAIVEAERRTA